MINEKVFCVEISPESMEALRGLALKAGHKRISGYQKVLDELIAQAAERA